MMESGNSTLATVREALDCVLAGDLERYLERFAEDAVFEFPFAPEAMPKQMHGKADIRRQLAPLWRMSSESGRHFTTFEPLTTYVVDRETIWIEFDAQGAVRGSDLPYSIRYVQLYRIRDGKIVLLRDYWNPAQLASLPKASAS